MRKLHLSSDINDSLDLFNLDDVVDYVVTRIKNRSGLSVRESRKYLIYIFTRAMFLKGIDERIDEDIANDIIFE